jgi:hypothetical protein
MYYTPDPDPTMPWGRFRGRRISTLPNKFLHWLSWHPLAADLRLFAMIELDRRQGRPVRRACPLCGGLVVGANHNQGPPP